MEIMNPLFGYKMKIASLDCEVSHIKHLKVVDCVENVIVM